MISAFSLIEIILIFTMMLFISTPWMFWSLIILYMIVQREFKKKIGDIDGED